MTDTINNKIPFVPENTIDPAAGLNLSLNTIDALLQVLVQTVGANTPPTGVEGQRFIVGTAPTGAWAGQANKLARFLDGVWQFFDVRYALNAADGLWYVRSGSTWAPLAGGGGGEANTASNLGAGEGIFSSKVGVDLRFKSLVAGTNITISSDGDTVTVNATGGGGGSGTVTSVALTAPTGFDVSGSPITGAGTLGLSFSSGYSLPTNTAQADWSAAFGWGNHALAGYEKELIAGANITIDRTDPNNPIISSTASGGGGGDVVGPAGAAANGVALFDGTSGKLLKDGGVLGSAAFTAATAYATAAQGALAGTALQPASIGVSVQDWSANLDSWSAIAPSAKQDTLVSATNIKTINGASVLGSGDLTIGGGPIVLAAQNTTTGTSYDYVDLPAGIKRIKVALALVSFNSAEGPAVQLGTAGGVVPTGYSGGASGGAVGIVTSASTSRALASAAGGSSPTAAAQTSGVIDFVRVSGNIWAWVVTAMHVESTTRFVTGAGSVDLGAELTRVRLTSVSGAGSFDGGSFSISYEV